MSKPNEITMSTNDLQELGEGIKSLQKSNELLSIHILQLKTLISGNELDKEDKGMIGQLREVVQDVEELKLSKKRIGWSIAGFMFAGSIFYAIIQIVINNFVKH